MMTTNSDFDKRRAAIHAQLEELQRERAAAEDDPEVLTAAEAGRDLPRIHAHRLDAINRKIQLCGVAIRQINQAEALAANAAALDRARLGEAELTRIQAAIDVESAEFDRTLALLCATWRKVADLAQEGREIADKAGFHREAWFGLEEDRLNSTAILIILHAMRWKAGVLGTGSSLGDIPPEGAPDLLAETLRDGATCYIPRQNPPEAA